MLVMMGIAVVLTSVHVDEDVYVGGGDIVALVLWLSLQAAITVTMTFVFLPSVNGTNSIVT